MRYYTVHSLPSLNIRHHPSTKITYHDSLILSSPSPLSPSLYTYMPLATSHLPVSPFLRISLLQSLLRPPRPLRKQALPSISQDGLLPLLHPQKPVPEARADATVERVCPERAPVEEGSHFDAEAPEVDGYAWWCTGVVSGCVCELGGDSI